MRNSQTYFSMLALALLMLQVSFVSCTGNTYNGDVEGITEKSPTISFGGKTNELTRATGPAAAAALNNSFVVYGFKTTGAGPETVFDHYTVNYTAGSDHTSQSNSAGWEYVGQTLSPLNSLPSGAAQSIKYWDFSATQYDFIAFSKGTATLVNTTPAAGQVQFTPVDNAHLSDAAYTITGAPADLAKVYIADRVTAQKEPASSVPNHLVAYKDAIQFAFKPLAAKVRIGLYETIPGYSVKDVRFYADDQSGTSPASGPVLFAGGKTIPNGVGTITVSFPETDPGNAAYNKAKVSYTSDESNKTQALTIGTLTASAAKEGKETIDNIYLGRTSSTASMTSDVWVVPTPADALTIKMDFTLVSIDYNETITVRGATATIPALYTNWQPNSAYTYIFKLSDKVGNAFGQLLYPIIFDALEVTDQWGNQQTITTVDQPSITTYAKGELGSDYFVGDNIYVSVANGTSKKLDEGNSKLYTATAANMSDITEKNIIENVGGITLTPAGNLSFAEYIDAADSPTGDIVYAPKDNSDNALSNFAKFTAAEGVYVFEYMESDPIPYANVDEYNAVNGTSLTASAFADLSAAEKIKVPAGSHYKVIRVNVRQ